MLSNASKPSFFEEGFEYTTEQRKRNKSQRKRTAVTGTSSSSKLKGAPEPSRDLFVYRVEKGTEIGDIEEYLTSKHTSCRSVAKVSNPDAKFDSFKVEIKASDMSHLLDANFWPMGICVRRFFKPRVNNSAEEIW